MTWTPIESSTFKEDQPARLRLKTGALVTGFYYDCAWMRHDPDCDDVEDCFLSGYADGKDHIEIRDIEAWRPATLRQISDANKRT